MKECHSQNNNAILQDNIESENEFLKQQNEVLKTKISRLKFLYKIKTEALDLSVLKLVDNCKYCHYKKFSPSCKKFSCSSGLKKYFMMLAKKCTER